MTATSICAAGLAVICWCSAPCAQDVDPVPVEKQSVPTTSPTAAPGARPWAWRKRRKAAGGCSSKRTRGTSATRHRTARLRMSSSCRMWETTRFSSNRSGPRCGCTSAPLVKNELAPGEEVPVEVTFSTRKANGPVRKIVTVISSDPEQGNYPLQFSAIIGGTPPTVGLVPESGHRLRPLSGRRRALGQRVHHQLQSRGGGHQHHWPAAFVPGGAALSVPPRAKAVGRSGGEDQGCRPAGQIQRCRHTGPGRSADHPAFDSHQRRKHDEIGPAVSRDRLGAAAGPSLPRPSTAGP